VPFLFSVDLNRKNITTPYYITFPLNVINKDKIVEIAIIINIQIIDFQNVMKIGEIY